MRKARSFGVAIIILVFCTAIIIPASAISRNYECSSTDSVSYEETDDSSYYLEVVYDWGTWVPFDNARVEGYAGALSRKAREVIYQLDDGSTDTGVVTNASYHILGAQELLTAKWGVELGNDTGTGYVIARVYNGITNAWNTPITYGQTVAHSLRLDIVP